jgi:uncharacterized integral membrane protein
LGKASDVPPTEEDQFDTANAPGEDHEDQLGQKSGRWGRRPRSAASGGDGVHHTRIGNAWVAVIVAAVVGVALVDFIVQNTRSVRIEFFSASGQMPVAVALLGAALAGAFIVLTVGIARTTQLRIANRRGKKRAEKAAQLADQGR